MIRMVVAPVLVIGLIPLVSGPAFAQPVPSTYSWSWEPQEARARVEAQAFADLAGVNGVCFMNFPPVAQWHDPNCADPPSGPPILWNWSNLPPLSVPQPPVPPVIPTKWDRYAPAATDPFPAPEMGSTVFVGPYCPSPSSDQQGNAPPPPPPGCALDWSQRVQFLAPVGLVFQNMFGRPGLMPEYQVQNSVYAINEDPIAPFPYVEGEASQIITVRSKRGLMGGTSIHQGSRTWELRLRQVAQTEALLPGGTGDRYVGETAATMVLQVPLEIVGLTPGRPFWMTFDFQLLAEAESENESHWFLDPANQLHMRQDVDNAYALASVNIFEGSGPSWLTQFTELAGEPPGFPAFPDITTGIGGSYVYITPSETSHPVGLRLISRVRTHIEDLPDEDDDRDFAFASMQANIWLTVFSPPILGPMVKIPAEGPGPDYDFWIGQHEVSNLEFVDFLNDAEADANDPGSPGLKSAYMQFGADGEVTTPGGEVMFSLIDSPVPGGSSTQKIRYRPHLPPGTRYVADPATESEAVVGVTWLGALKYSNWLTLHMDYPASERCYTEGDALAQWHPISITEADWAARDLNDTERAELVANCKGFRLPMDNLGTATGHISDQVNAFNEWYKASAYDPLAPDSERTGPGGETVPPLHWVYGFGRDVIGHEDANYLDSNDPFDNGVAYVGFFDGSNELADGRATRDTANPYGLYDLSGNVAEWGQDQGPGFPVDPDNPTASRVTRTGAWLNDPAEMAASWRDHEAALGASAHTGFRVLTTFFPSDELFHDRFEEIP